VGSRAHGAYIMYVLQTTIKSQTLVDFMVEWTETQEPPTPVTREHWSMYFITSSDGESNCHDSCMAAYCQEVRKLRRSLKVLNFITSSDGTTSRPTPSLDSGIDMNGPHRACSYKTSPSHPSGSMKTTRHLCRGPHRVEAARDQLWIPT
jgi:hypothetical protein